MPVLHRSADGHYYVLRHHRDHQTWQVTGEGVRFLKFRSIVEEQFFPTDLFFDLWSRGLVFTGAGRAAALPRPSSELPPELRERMRALFAALRAADPAAIRPLLFSDRSSEPDSRVTQFDDRLQPGRIVKWAYKDAILVPLPSGFGQENDLRVLARLRVRVCVDGADAEVTPIWLLCSTGWLVSWGFLEQHPEW